MPESINNAVIVSIAQEDESMQIFKKYKDDQSDG